MGGRHGDQGRSGGGHDLDIFAEVAAAGAARRGYSEARIAMHSTSSSRYKSWTFAVKI